MRPLLAGCACFLAVGCVSANVQRLDDTVRPARAPASVTVLLEEPQRAFTVIAVVEASSDAVFDSFDDLRDSMVAEAASLGGDALILGEESTDTNFILTGTSMIQSDRKELKGRVIVFEAGRSG